LRTIGLRLTGFALAEGRFATTAFAARFGAALAARATGFRLAGLDLAAARTGAFFGDFRATRLGAFFVDFAAAFRGLLRLAFCLAMALGPFSLLALTASR
jgi:hypothetical protein